jgi:hypothetical protein
MGIRNTAKDKSFFFVYFLLTGHFNRVYSTCISTILEVFEVEFEQRDPEPV